MQLLLVESDHVPASSGVGALARELGWEVECAGDYGTALTATRSKVFDITILPAPDCGQCGDDADYLGLIELIVARDGSALLLGDESDATRHPHPGIIEPIARDAPLAELRGRLAMIDRYHARFRRLEDEVHRMEQLGQRLKEHFREVDQEMQLAARLQRDFLPSMVNPIENVRFATIFRPASWVSGDIFDVFRVDEDHTALYVADAVGHGVAASLLTIFIKRTILAKRVRGSEYDILPPSETMGILNDGLADQGLPNCQFVTAFYAIINHKTLTMAFARAGHPYPVHVTRDGVLRELKSPGGLLGLFKGESFPTQEVQLHAGDKLVVFTDGVELAFQRNHPDKINPIAYLDCFRSLAGFSISEMMHRIGKELDDEPGSITPHDDITLLGLEVLTD